MSVIDITRAHDLDLETVRERAEELAERLKEKVSIDYRWNGNRIEFERRGASGHIDVTESEVRVFIELALLLRPLHGKVESKVHQYLDETLGTADG
ncbi:MAG: polyhydroxyalkanoic acid system family protein [Deltaproteobacteria bacterium]|nr:polyhydroxyalkanoic acid system family protein [Deltaproteobacteria bacterium]